MADCFIEGNLGAKKIGTTGKGIGPAYSSKILRQGLRMGDLLNFDSFVHRLRVMADYYKKVYVHALPPPVQYSVVHCNA